MFNLKDVNTESTGTFSALPEDRYTLRVEAAKFTTNRTGKPIIETTFVVDEGKYKGRKIWNNFALTEKALPIIVRLLKVVNPTVANSPKVDGDEIADALVGGRASYMLTPGVSTTGKPKNDLDVWSLQAVENTASSASGQGAPAPSAKPSANELFR